MAPTKTINPSPTPAAAAPVIDEDALAAKITAAVLANLPGAPAPASTVAGVTDVVEFGEPDTPWTVGETVTQPTDSGRPRFGQVVAVDGDGNPQVAWFAEVTDPIHRGDPTLTRA